LYGADDAKPLALALSADVYAKTIFYDCNVLEQFTQDGPREVENTDEHILYHAGQVKEKVFEDTRFVEWKEFKGSDGTVPKTDNEADTMVGSMTNLYLEDDSSGTQKRVDFNKKEDVRQVGVTLYGLPQSGEEHSFMWSAFIVEHKSGTNKEHLLSMRKFDHNDRDKIYLLLAHYKADGASLLEAECDIEEDEDYNKSCADAEYEVSYYNKTTDEIENDIPTGFKKTKEDFLINVNSSWAHGNYFADKLDPTAPFFAGTTGTIADKRKEFFKANLPKE